MSIEKKIALVTGASRGIGAAIAQRLGRDGFTVIINFAGNVDAAQAVAKEIQQNGGTAVTARADVSDVDAVKQMFDTAESTYGGIDVLVNNAGIMSLAPLATMTDYQFNKLIDINLKGTFNTLREAANRLRRGGRIINLSTSVVGLKLETYGAYAATKAAVETLTMIMAKELRGKNITVNAVAPGPTATELFLTDKSNELIDRISKMNPLERLGTPNDIAKIVSFLASPDGEWVNAQVLRANGGLI